jgi:hypothetical protein
MRASTSPRRSRRSSRSARDVGRERLVAAVAVVVLFVIAGGALALISPGKSVSLASGASVAGVWSKRSSATTATTEPHAPTPFFAVLRGVRLRLPVPPRAVTVLAFHQSSYSDTVALSSLVKIGDSAKYRAAATAARAAISAGQHATIVATPADAVETDAGTWTGSALQLWRTSRGGVQNTAVDCGSAPGTPVFSPVDGTVMEVRPYKLYKKYDDFEIHIKPDAWNDLDVIVLHVTDPAVPPGTHVTAGLTRIARVRRLSNLVSGLQLRNYSLDGGNHTHFQVNTIPRPNDTWVFGQDPPGLVRHD